MRSNSIAQRAVILGRPLAFATLALGSCIGSIDGVEDTGVSGVGVPGDRPGPDPRPRDERAPPAAGACGTDQTFAVPVRLRRLTPDEYKRSVAALLGSGNVTTAVRFPTDATDGAFLNSAAHLRVTDVLVDRLMVATEEYASRLTANIASLVPCDPARAGEEACARQFLQSFAERAYRRPVTSGEVDRITGLWRLGRDGGDFRSGLLLALQLVLQSPKFLYRTELGPPGAAGDVVTLTPHEIAAQLSYLASSEPPDTELLTAAGRGELTDPEARERQLRRLLRQPGARPAFAAFVNQWLEVDDVEQAQKDPKLYPSFRPELAAMMLAETSTLISEVVFSGDGRLKTLLSADFTFVDGKYLPRLYGVAPPTGAGLQRVAMDPAQRAGLLTQPSVMTTHSTMQESSPVTRGKLVRTRILCQELPPPPDDLMVTIPAPNPKLTTRQRFEQHASDPLCNACHAMIDPIGNTFESFDAIGAHRRTENGLPVDTRGALTGTLDADGVFDSGAALARRLSDSVEVRACFAEHWASYALGREVPRDEGCAVRNVTAEFVAGRATLPDLMAMVVRAKSFVQRTVPR